ncbi:hypothetical protein [Sulfurimonas sp.]
MGVYVVKVKSDYLICMIGKYYNVRSDNILDRSAKHKIIEYNHEIEH